MSAIDREALYQRGLELAEKFCAANDMPMPAIKRLARTDRLYQLATCAFYRPHTITIMVEKCAVRGMGGRAWSWPGYAIDRTPYGVIQHELGHHVDELFFRAPDSVLSRRLHGESAGEAPLTGYVGTDKRELTFYMEWFAENFRLFVTNPDLSRHLRPRFFRAMQAAGFVVVVAGTWDQVLVEHGATMRIVDQARRKIEAVRLLGSPANMETQLL